MPIGYNDGSPLTQSAFWTLAATVMNAADVSASVSASSHDGMNRRVVSTGDDRFAVRMRSEVRFDALVATPRRRLTLYVVYSISELKSRSPDWPTMPN